MLQWEKEGYNCMKHSNVYNEIWQKINHTEEILSFFADYLINYCEGKLPKLPNLSTMS